MFVERDPMHPAPVLFFRMVRLSDSGQNIGQSPDVSCLFTTETIIDGDP